MKRAIIYARVSSEEQEREGYSIEAQLSLMRKYAKSNSINVIQEFTEIQSAKQLGRKQFQEMMKLLEQDPSIQLIVEKVDRFTRNWDDAAWMIKLIDQLGANVHFVKEGFNLSEKSKSHEHLMFDIQVSFARHYVRKLGEEASKGMMQKAREGVWPSRAPVGYLNTHDGHRKVVTIDPLKAPLVKHLFQQVANERLSLDRASKLAETIGLTSTTGRTIKRTSVYALLKNPIYIGLVKWNGETHQGVHDPIIDQATFQSVQDALSGRKALKKKNRPNEYAFRGLVKCSKCGRSLAPERKSGRHKRGDYVYYSCKNPQCEGVGSLRSQMLDQLFAGVVESVVLSDGLCDEITLALKQSLDSEQDFARKEQAALRAKANRARTRLKQLVIEKIDGTIDRETFESLKGDWEIDVAESEAKIHQHDQAEHNYFEVTVDVLDLIRRAPQIYAKAEEADKRAIAMRYTEKLTYDGENLEPHLTPLLAAIASFRTYDLNPNTRGSKDSCWLPWRYGLRNAA